MGSSVSLLLLHDKEVVEHSGYKKSQLDRHVFEFLTMKSWGVT